MTEGEVAPAWALCSDCYWDAHVRCPTAVLVADED